MGRPRVRIVGPGRAGGSLAGALAERGWEVLEPVRRGDDPAGAAAGTDLVVVATPDAAVASVARAVRPVPGVAVVHLSGALGLDVLAPHERAGALHPLVALPSAEVGARRLLEGAWFAVAGDEVTGRLVADLGGRSFVVADADRAAYHAAACIASNHLVALMGQVERVAVRVGVPLEAYLDLAVATLANVGELGPAAALTGPAARGDDATLAAHLRALDPSERDAYRALVAQARRLAGRVDPTDPEEAPPPS
jgi:predicted short-subunit dehydrogenase-like oxidoreductase (DUF2520 family)